MFVRSSFNDSTYAINVATGKWRARPANGELARRLRNATRKLIRARGACSVRFRHVRAHMGEPGNEAADALAKAAVKGAMMCGTSQDVLDLARRAHERAASARAGHDQRGQPAGRLVGIELGRVRKTVLSSSSCRRGQSGEGT